MCLQRYLIELRSENVANGIALKGSTDMACIPVNVLKTTFTVSIRLDAQFFEHPRPPRIRKIFRVEPSLKHLEFAIKP